MQRAFVIPAAGALTVALTGCGKDPITGSWDLVRTVQDGEATVWPYARFEDIGASYGYTYTYDGYFTQQVVVHAMKSGLDVVHRSTYDVEINYEGEIYEFLGASTELGRAWNSSGRTYEIVVPSSGLDLSCELDADRVECGKVGAPQDTFTFERVPAG